MNESWTPERKAARAFKGGHRGRGAPPQPSAGPFGDIEVFVNVNVVQLGYDVPHGEVVRIPRKHLAITGQTQEAGKTTTLEALIERSGLRAVTFITKRGEGSFRQARQIAPYFREETDWQFVASVLEASRGEKLKFERAWIIRASKGARTLADVQANVKRFLADPKQRGMSADVYLTLDAYLEVVVPAIARVRWAPALELAGGINAIDLRDVPDELQHLVIKSSLDWVLKKEESTVVVVPEAWKFIPQGRNTPVKLAAAAFIRQGAALGNYLWLDSQDLGGIEKEILRSVPVWLLGVQREANEIKRTLDNIPAGISKPSKADIATLELGQFYACWGKHAIKTYVQPAWMDAAEAQHVAMGHAQAAEHYAAQRTAKEVGVTNEEAAGLRFQNESLTRQFQQAEKDCQRLVKENDDLRRRIEAIEKGSHDVSNEGQSTARRGGEEGRAADRGGAGAPGARTGGADHRGGAARPGAGHATRPFTPQESFDNEALYQAIKARLIDELPADAKVMQIVLSRPELRVEVERQVIQVSEGSTRGLVAKLIADGFYEKGQSSAATLKELQRRGQSLSPGTLYPELDKLAGMGFFRIEDGQDDRGRPRKEYHLVPGMKVNVVER